MQRLDKICLVFRRLPLGGLRFVETETTDGRAVFVGRWVDVGEEYAVLELRPEDFI